MVKECDLRSSINTKDRKKVWKVDLNLNNKIYHMIDISDEDVKIKGQWTTVPVIWFDKRKQTKRFGTKELTYMLEKTERPIYVSLNDYNFKPAKDFEVIKENKTFIIKAGKLFKEDENEVQGGSDDQ